MIIDIRGTNGSGKTRLVRSLLQTWRKGKFRPMPGDGLKRSFGYECIEARLRIIGPYEPDLKTGGVDALKGWLRKRNPNLNSMEEFERIVRAYAKDGWHVMYEGMAISASWTRWANLAKDYPMLFMFLDTPLETCYQRVLARSGKTPKGYPGSSGLEDFYARQQRYIGYAKQAGLVHMIVPHQDALTTLIKVVQAL